MRFSVIISLFIVYCGDVTSAERLIEKSMTKDTPMYTAIMKGYTFDLCKNVD